MFRVDGRVRLEPLVGLLGRNHTLRIVLDDLTIHLNRSNQLRRGQGLGEAAGDCGTEVSEAVMASLVVLLLTAIAFGALFGAFLKISFAIRREDRARNSLRFDAPDISAKAARALVGVSSSRWD